MQIRAEQPTDHAEVEAVQRAAFGAQGAEVAALVRDLRRSMTTEPGWSLVATNEAGVVGHALFTRSLLDAPRRLVEVQVLSPLAVRPDAQRQGVGADLVRHGVRALDAAGVPAVFLEGSPDYYGRLGFLPAGDHGFRRPSLRIPPAAFQVRLLSSYEPWISGTLVYRQEFWDHDLVGLREDPAPR